MSSGYLYILSNAYLGSDILKIGLTTREPTDRAAALSRSTAIPGPFDVKFVSPVRDCKLAERRLHLLLKEQRVNKNKEFFRLPVYEAISLCEAISTFEAEEMPASQNLLIHPDFLFTQIHPRQSLHILKALMHILSTTQHNSFLDRLLEERLLIVDGFTCAEALARFRGIRAKAAATTLRTVAEVAPDLTYSLPKVARPIPLFSKFVYDKGHVAWTLQPEFRRLFIVSHAIER